jgi:hypothetical protein
LTAPSTILIVSSPIAGGSIYINSTVQIKKSGVVLKFASPVIFGPLGRIRTYGAYASTPASGFPHLTTNANAGDTAVIVTDRSYFAANTYIEIRGDHDITGAATWFDYALVTSVTPGSGTTGTLHLAAPLVNSYTVSYTSGSFTEVVAIASALFTVSPNRGDRVAVVGSSASFVTGDYVQILDDSVTTSSAGASQPENYARREIAQVRSVIDGTHILFDRALHHSYTTGQNARIAKIAPVIDSHVIGAQVSWNAQATTLAAFEQRFTVDCSFRDCVATGATYSWLNQAFRTNDSYGSYVENCQATNPALSSAGQGYGATIYGSSHCKVRNSRFSGCRHSVLFYNGAAGNLVESCTSNNALISDYDLHGANARDNRIAHCLAVGGSSVPDDSATPIKAAFKLGNENHVEGDQYNTFEDCWVVNYIYNGTAGAFQVVPQSSHNTFKNCRVIGASYGIRLLANSSATTLVTSDTVFDGCEFEDCTNLTTIDGGTSSMIVGLLLKNNTFTRATTKFGVSNADKVRLQSNLWLDPNQGATVYAVDAVSVTHLQVKNNDMSGCYRGVKLATCPNARIFRNVMHDLVDTTLYEDVGGNTGAYFAENDVIGFTPFSSYPNPPGVRNSGSGPSAQQVIKTIANYTPDTPQQHGYVEWNFDPIAVEGTTAPTAGTRYRMKFTAKTGGPITTLALLIGTAGVGVTALANCFAALYDDSGARLALSADMSSDWATNGGQVHDVPLGTTVNLNVGHEYYAELLVGTQSTTPVTFGRAATTTSVQSANQTNAQQRFGTDGTGVSTMLNPIVPSSLGGNALLVWLGFK